jgi:ribonuclease PH
MQRAYGRLSDQLRTPRVSYNTFGYADASVLFEMGNTKVLCAVTLQNSVPPFLKGQKKGWLSAEYAMLPTATETRVTREATSAQRNGRSVEISRMIGRVLRTTVNLDVLGERTIQIDCDVLQADGGTRVAAITGASLALTAALKRWIAAGLVPTSIVGTGVAAISVGISNGTILLDLDFIEDSNIDADFNIVLTRSGDIIEIQGTSEHAPVTWEQMNEMCQVARAGIADLCKLLDAQNESADQHLALKPAVKHADSKGSTVPLFSLQNRIQSTR